MGCARYGKNAAGEYPGCPTVYYFPGTDATETRHATEAVCNMFCPLHAADVYWKKKIRARYPPGSKIASVPRTQALSKHRSKLVIKQVNEPIGRYNNLDTVAVPVTQAKRATFPRRSPAKRRSSSNSKPTRAEAIARGTPSGQYNDSDEEEVEAELETEAVPIAEVRKAPTRRPAKRKFSSSSSKPTHTEAIARKSDGGNGHRNGDKGEDDRKPPAKRTKLEPAVETPDGGEMDTSCVGGNVDDDAADDERLSAKKCQGISLNILLNDKDADASLVEERFAQLASNAVDCLAEALRQGKAWPLSVREYHGALFKGEDPWWYVSAWTSFVVLLFLCPSQTSPYLSRAVNSRHGRACRNEV